MYSTYLPTSIVSTISTITIFKVLPCQKIPAEMGKDWSVKYANKTGYWIWRMSLRTGNKRGESPLHCTGLPERKISELHISKYWAAPYWQFSRYPAPECVGGYYLNKTIISARALSPFLSRFYSPSPRTQLWKSHVQIKHSFVITFSFNINTASGEECTVYREQATWAE